MATRKAKPPAASAEKQDASAAPVRSDDVKITVKRKRRRLYDPVPEPATTEPAEIPATADRKRPAKARKRPAKKARERAPAATAAETPEPTAAAAAGRGETAQPGRATRAESAQELVKKYSLGSAAIGLVPLPLVDLVVFSVLQTRMLKSLTELYEVEYSEQRARIFTGALVGSVTSISVARQTGVLLGSVLKSLPAVGQLAGAALMPAATGATTYALGKVFIQHFETGGTLLDFDAEKMRAYYERQVAEASGAPGRV